MITVWVLQMYINVYDLHKWACTCIFVMRGGHFLKHLLPFYINITLYTSPSRISLFISSQQRYTKHFVTLVVMDSRSDGHLLAWFLDRPMSAAPDRNNPCQLERCCPLCANTTELLSNICPTLKSALSGDSLPRTHLLQLRCCFIVPIHQWGCHQKRTTHSLCRFFTLESSVELR